jgi:hypothetical protein
MIVGGDLSASQWTPVREACCWMAVARRAASMSPVLQASALRRAPESSTTKIQANGGARSHGDPFGEAVAPKGLLRFVRKGLEGLRSKSHLPDFPSPEGGPCDGSSVTANSSPRQVGRNPRKARSAEPDAPGIQIICRYYLGGVFSSTSPGRR